MIQAIEITDLEHDQFVKDHPLGDMCQLISWAKVKAQFGWQWDRVSVGDGQKITGVSTLLYKKIPLINKTICYAPRGFILDWNDSETLASLLEAVKVNAKKHDAILIKVDPNIDREEDHYLTLFQKLGFKHQGFSLGFKDGIQPRFVMVTDISLEEKKLLKSFVSKTRTDVRKSGRFGLIFEDAPLEKMSIFSRLMDETGERDGFLTRNVSYFEEIYKQMNPQNEAKLFLVKMVADETIDSLQKEIVKREKEIRQLMKRDLTEGSQHQIDILNRSIENNQALIKEIKAMPDQEIYLSGGIFIQSGPKSYYLYGASSNNFRDLLPNYFMIWQMMLYAKAQGCTSFDFGGVSGMDDLPEEEDEAPGLYTFKKQWNAQKEERIGEFDHILSPMWYRIYQWAMAVRKWKIKMMKSDV